MKKFLVSSGGVDEVLEAESHEAACVAFVRVCHESEEPPELGRLMSVIEVAESDLWYMGTEEACKKAGCWAGDKAKPTA